MMRIIRLSLFLLATAGAIGCTEKEEDFFRSILGFDDVLVGDLNVRVLVGAQPRQGAQVGIEGAVTNTTRTATTDANGMAFFVGLPPDQYGIMTGLQNHTCGPQTATVQAGQTTTTDVSCTPQPGSVRGRVTVDDEGRGGVQVVLSRGQTTLGSTATDSNGNYQFDDVDPGEVTVTISPPSDADCPTVEQTATVEPGQPTTIDFACMRVIPTGSQIAGGYRLDGVGGENTCPTGNPFPQPGEQVVNPGPIEVRAEQSDGQTIVTIVSNTEMAGPLNTETGEWTGMGTEPISSSLDLWETTTGGQWQFDPDMNVLYDSGAELQFRVVDNRGTSDPTDDLEVCRAVVEDVQYTRLGDFVPSSARYKRDVWPLLPEGVTLLGLRPVAFRYRPGYGDPAVLRIGLIAEDVARVFPAAVARDRGGRPMAISYPALTTLLIEEIQRRVEGRVKSVIEDL